MNFTSNQLMIMLAIKSGAERNADIAGKVAECFGLKLAPSSVHQTVSKSIKSKDVKAITSKAGRKTVTYQLTSDGNKRLAKAMAGFDKIRG